jgi:hypothetical protein
MGGSDWVLFLFTHIFCILILKIVRVIFASRIIINNNHWSYLIRILFLQLYLEIACINIVLNFIVCLLSREVLPSWRLLALRNLILFFLVIKRVLLNLNRFIFLA